MLIKQALMDWLLEGDPAIRWQVMKDLQHAPPEVYETERTRLNREGWSAQLLGSQAEDGLWNCSLYNGKWLSTTYSIYLLKLLGLPAGNQQALRGCEQLIDQGLYQEREIRFSRDQEIADLGVSALVLSLCCYFGFESPAIHQMAVYLAGRQGGAGNWLPKDNPSAGDYTFETTLLILEALFQFENQYSGNGTPSITSAVQKGQEFLLGNNLGFENGRSMKSQWATLSFPPYWFYDILTALDYFYACGKKDKRLQPAIDLVSTKQAKDGTWLLGSRHPGKTYFDMDLPGKPSRWNTLRVIRILAWWESN